MKVSNNLIFKIFILAIFLSLLFACNGDDSDNDNSSKNLVTNTNNNNIDNINNLTNNKDLNANISTNIKNNDTNDNLNPNNTVVNINNNTNINNTTINNSNVNIINCSNQETAYGSICTLNLLLDEKDVFLDQNPEHTFLLSFSIENAENKIVLSWQYNDWSIADKTIIYHSNSIDGSWEKIAEVSENVNTYSDEENSEGFWRIQAVSEGYVSAFSKIISLEELNIENGESNGENVENSNASSQSTQFVPFNYINNKPGINFNNNKVSQTVFNKKKISQVNSNLISFNNLDKNYYLLNNNESTLQFVFHRHEVDFYPQDKKLIGKTTINATVESGTFSYRVRIQLLSVTD